VKQYTLLDPRRRWVNAPPAPLIFNWNAHHTGRLLRDGELSRVLSQAELQVAERRACRRYRLHGELAPVSFLGRGASNWTSLRGLSSDEPSSQGYLVDFFSAFTYQLMLPSRAVPTGEPHCYRLFYRAVPGVEIEPLPGTLGCDPWGGGRFLYAASQPFTLPDTGVAGLPLPLPRLECALLLTHRTARMTWRDNRRPAVAAGTPTGFSMSQVSVAAEAVVTWVLANLRPPTWRGWLRAGVGPYITSRLAAVWAETDLQFTLETVKLNPVLARYALNIATATEQRNPYNQLTKDWVGPVIRLDPADGEIEYLPGLGVEYLLSQAVVVPDTAAQEAELKRLGYDYTRLSRGQGLEVSFGFAWNPWARVPLRALAQQEEETVEKAAGLPSWAWLNETTQRWSWRDLLATGGRRGDRGIEAPYVNDSHYVYARVAHYVGPDLQHRNSLRAFARTLPTVTPGTPLAYSAVT
jgi:hypothetical protein